MTKAHLEKHNQLLWAALNTANKYLAKAVADNELQGTCIPVGNIHHYVTDVLADTKNSINH